MSRIAKLTALTALATTAVLGAATGASAHDHGSGGASASAGAAGSPGVLSGNVVQVPVSIPINACGNTVDVIGLLNPAFGNSCADNTQQQNHHQG
ncbi:chaplin [Streptomyces sp. Ru73]|uniref:chaplin n=1 Tax=Streptomyces sp. Ru73 TaxID=2080748 RepID=UPI000CDDA2AD|nr:chaplin [Streptomyces sp. Ru73]POX37783.1 chaplin [Streptomyces sp. Ru73]